MTELAFSEWANARIEKLTSAKTPFAVGEPCRKCGESLYYVREGRSDNGCIRCHEDKSTNTILTPIEGAITDGNGVKLRPRLRPKAGCKVCGGQWILDQNAYGQKAGYCHQCALDAVPEREKSKAINKLGVVVNKAFYSVMHSSVMRSGTDAVLPRNAAEWYSLKDLVERLTLMNEQEKLMNTGIRWELAHIYPAAGASEGDVNRGVCRIENLSIIESRRNRAEGNDRPEEWQAVQVITFDRLQAILKNQEASAALKARKAAIVGVMTKQQKADFDTKIKASDEKHRELTADLVKSESHQLELLLNTILTPSFADYLQQMSHRLEALEYKTSRLIDGLIASGRAEETFIQINERRLLVSSFMGFDARLRVVVQTLQRIEDAHEAAEQEPDYNEGDWYTLTKAAVLWSEEALKNQRVQLVGFSHPLLKNAAGELWGISIASDGKQYLCVWEDEPEDNDSLPFDSREWEGWQQRKKITAAIDDGWQRCVDVFTYERESQRKARAAAKAKRDAAEQAAIQIVYDAVSTRLVELVALVEKSQADWTAALNKALQYYESEHTEQTPKAFFISELTEQHADKYQVDEVQNSAAIAACQEFLQWQHVTAKAAKQAAHEALSLPAGGGEYGQSLMLMQPFGGVWLNAADRAKAQQQQEAHQRAEIERSKQRAADAHTKEDKARKAAFMKSADGQRWLRERQQQGTKRKSVSTILTPY